MPDTDPNPNLDPNLDLAPARQQWRSLSTRVSESIPSTEFSEGASNPAGLSRKEFLRLMGASLALGGAAACTRQPPERILPYVHQPEGLTPGEAQWYATAMELGPHVQGLLVKSHEGRPTKIEGNPDHPMTLGRSSVHAQAALLDLYDPDRSPVVRHHGDPSTWEDFLGALAVEQAKWARTGGEGVRLLLGSSASPTFAWQIARFLEKYPQARCHHHDAAFAQAQTRIHDLADVEIIVSLDADFLGGAASPRDTAIFAQRRRAEAAMIRLYVLESMPSLTGAMADHRLALSPAALEQAAEEIATGVKTGSEGENPMLKPIIRDLLAHRGKSLILAGDYQSAKVRGYAIEAHTILGSGAGLTYSTTPGKPPIGDLRSLIREVRAGVVTALFILETNPASTALGDFPFPALPAELFSVHSSSYLDETAQQCLWHIPQSHFLETWSDTLAADGTSSIVQPLIEPLYPSKSRHELLCALLESGETGYETVRNVWRASRPAAEFEPYWRKTLHDGVVKLDNPQTLRPPEPVSDRKGVEHGTLDLVIRPDPHLLDGRFANNAWLQELPKPLTRLTWGNAVHLSSRTAAEYHLQHGDEVELRKDERRVTGPVFILPGHADGCATVHLGGGRARAGRIGNGVGFDVTPLQTFDSPWLSPGVTLRATGKKHLLATTQEHQSMEGRDPVRVLHQADGKLTPEKLDSLYPAVTYTSPSWGMVIDLSTCTGCGTCTIACQAENNIPVVGREEVLRGREMHWIRVDRYFDGPPEAPRILHQPVPCMHCENAPCELVCPVAATVHDHQGLNLMVYNRCVGTRYCSNNCPYKVRRFNFFQYADHDTPQLKLQRNPDVSVRSRGVMEKCTYCVQRISAAQIQADVQNRPIRDGEVVPACAQACPANAIAFGDILDPASRVAQQRLLPRHYALLEELNTRPRTTYLAKVFNRNPETNS